MNNLDPRPSKPAEDLDDRDRIWVDGAIREVRHVEPFTLSTMPKVTVIVAGGTCYTWPSRSPVAIATDEDLAAAETAELRKSMVTGLRKFADLMSKQALPVPTYSIDVRGVLSNEAEVRAWAAALRVPVIEATDQMPYVSAEWAWPSLDVPSYERRVEARVHAPREKKTSAEVSTPSATAQEGTPAQSGDPARTGSPDAPTAQAPAVTHIRCIGSSRSNLCAVVGGEATYPSAATCPDCTAAYAMTTDSPAGRDLAETPGPAAPTASPTGVALAAARRVAERKARQTGAK